MNALLIKSARSWDLDGVKTAVEKGADVNYLDEMGESAITSTIKFVWMGNAGFEEYDNMTSEQKAELKCKYEQESIGIIQYLLEHGADIDKCANGGLNPLTESRYSMSLVLAKFLLEHGANPNVNCYDGIAGEEDQWPYSSSVMASIFESVVDETPEETMIWNLCKEYGGKLYKDDKVPDHIENNPEMLAYCQGK